MSEIFFPETAATKAQRKQHFHSTIKVEFGIKYVNAHFKVSLATAVDFELWVTQFMIWWPCY